MRCSQSKDSTVKNTLLVLVFPAVFCSAGPLSDIPALAETWHENQYVFPIVEEVPPSMLPKGVTDLIIAGVPSGELSLTLYLIGNGPKGPDVLASGPYEGEYNFAKSFASWEADRAVLSLYFQMPYSARYSGAEYRWRGNEMIPVNWLAGDPSLDALERIDSLLWAGEIGMATRQLGEIFYPGHYYDSDQMFVRFLISAHELGLDEHRRGSPENAVRLFKEAEEAMLFLFIPYPWYRMFEDTSSFQESSIAFHITMDEFVQIANNYGFFLEQADMYEEAVDVLYGVLTLKPDRMVAYLNLADALWGLGERQNAATQYLVYAGMMKEAGLEAQIPARVDQRVVISVGSE